MNKYFLFLLVLFSTCMFQLHAQTNSQLRTERIINFDALITLDTNGVLTVEEKIEFLVQGDAIKRGIFRELPLHRKNRLGEK